MPLGRVGAVGRDPVGVGPGVAVEVADASVGGGEVALVGEYAGCDGEDGVDVAEQGDVRVEEADGVVRSEFKDS